MVLVSWDLVCQPKAHGGLGIRSLRDHNTSFMMKLGFNIVFNSSALSVCLNTDGSVRLEDALTELEGFCVIKMWGELLASTVITNGNPKRLVKWSIAGIVEAMSTMEINETHVENKLYCLVYKEQFELETKVHNSPCDHMYHS
ncbi:hypothetical protein PVK06_020672 [Gossypium arboreum]|uniref:Uncharacterized protein n=1 Tax=Gossypium arboreum TaxID=29729 RepID=A0ABR0PND5_GOSAR|nr:hypothetical protein PVK06_020672 [Gossypium arboreum]